MKLRKTGVFIVFAAFLFCVAETIYFGSNFLPASQQERLCDGIASVGLLVGMMFCCAESK